MKERVRFVLEWEQRWKDGEGVMNMSELCREFGVTRALLTVSPSNAASIAVVLAHGAMLDGQSVDAAGEPLNRYWINLIPTL